MVARPGRGCGDIERHGIPAGTTSAASDQRQEDRRPQLITDSWYDAREKLVDVI